MELKAINNLLIIIFLCGCLSEEERRARLENALDISGKYETIKKSEIQMSLDIKNETGKHDIFLTLARSQSSIPRAEVSFLSKIKKDYNIDPDRMREPPTKITFGANPPDRGLIVQLVPSLANSIDGENTSEDLGQTSKFSMCEDQSPEYKVRTRNRGADEKLFIIYCLSGTVKKERKDFINGIFSVVISHSYINKDNQLEDITEIKPLEFSYTARKEKALK